MCLLAVHLSGGAEHNYICHWRIQKYRRTDKAKSGGGETAEVRGLTQKSQKGKSQEASARNNSLSLVSDLPLHPRIWLVSFNNSFNLLSFTGDTPGNKVVLVQLHYKMTLYRLK